MKGVPQFQLVNITQVASDKRVSLPLLAPPEQHQKQGIQLAQSADKVLLRSFICGILGNPGAGKSTIIQQMLLSNQFFGERFERVLFIGPTTYPRLIQDEKNTRKILDIGWIYGQIEECNQWKCNSMLIIMDDVVSSMKNTTNPAFVDLFYNRRHLLNQGTVSLIVSSQKWNLVPTFIRSSYNMMILFNTAKSQLDTITRQISLPLEKKLKRWQFIYINLQDHKVFNSDWKQL